MSERVLLRTISNLSFAGEICSNILDGEKGILLKPSPNSNIKIWCPQNEIQNLIMKNGKMIKGDELENEIGLQ